VEARATSSGLIAAAKFRGPGRRGPGWQGIGIGGGDRWIALDDETWNVLVSQPVVAESELRILDAAKRCVERWGFERLTVDDIAAEAGVSRATLYRIFPGGKDVLFEALRVRERAEFFDELTAEVADVDDFEDLVVRLVVTATRALRDDDHLALMLASAPGEILVELTAAGVPRIVATATDYLAPLLKPHLDDADTATPFIELLVRVTLSYFLAPSDHVDLGDPDSARSFLGPAITLLSTRTTEPS
jgi:AcrR family transcriptional regulator